MALFYTPQIRKDVPNGRTYSSSILFGRYHRLAVESIAMFFTFTFDLSHVGLDYLHLCFWLFARSSGKRNCYLLFFQSLLVSSLAGVDYLEFYFYSLSLSNHD